MIKIFTAGGLGNRLFQSSFAHFLKKETHLPVELVDCRHPNSPPHLKQMLNSIVSQCNHIDASEVTNRLMLQIVDPWARRGHHANISDTRENPFFSPSELRDSRVLKRKYLGYFQNKHFVYEVENQLLEDLSGVVTSGIEYQKKFGPYEVVHIRGGDYRNHENINKFGVLSDKYYRRVLGKSNDRLRFVVTDDIDWAKTLINLQPYERIFGPADLDSITCLALMSGSKSLVAANSTFSWWGGFLAASQGGQVIFPEPIFKSNALFSGNALNYRSFTLAQALFV